MSTYKRNNTAVDIGGFNNCPGFLERYLNYLETFENLKTGSIVDIFTVLREYCQYIHFCRKMQCEPSTKDAHKDMDICLMPLQEVCDLSQEGLERYLCFLEIKVRNSSKTICKKLNFIKKFHLYLERNTEELGVCLPHGNPARFLELPQTAVANPVVLSKKEIELLANSTSGENADRDKAMILLLATTGIQTAELISLDRGDIRGNALVIRSPNSFRTVFLTEACKQALNKYLHTTREYSDHGDPLFIAAATGKRLTARSVQLRIEKAAAMAKLNDKTITARTLRNTAAAMLFRSNGEERQADVRRYLGVKSRSSMRNLVYAEPTKNEENRLNLTKIAQIGEK